MGEEKNVLVRRSLWRCQGGMQVPSADTQLTNMEALKVEQFMLENNGL